MRFQMTKAIYHLFNVLHFLGLCSSGSSGETETFITTELAMESGDFSSVDSGIRVPVVRDVAWRVQETRRYVRQEFSGPRPIAFLLEISWLRVRISRPRPKIRGHMESSLLYSWACTCNSRWCEWWLVTMMPDAVGARPNVYITPMRSLCFDSWEKADYT